MLLIQLVDMLFTANERERNDITPTHREKKKGKKKDKEEKPDLLPKNV